VKNLGEYWYTEMFPSARCGQQRKLSHDTMKRCSQSCYATPHGSILAVNSGSAWPLSCWLSLLKALGGLLSWSAVEAAVTAAMKFDCYTYSQKQRPTQQTTVNVSRKPITTQISTIALIFASCLLHSVSLQESCFWLS